jgi:putative transposase
VSEVNSNFKHSTMEKEPTEPFDYEVAKQKLREQFRTGKSLFGKGGAFAPLLQEMLNSMLEGEIDGHLDQEERIPVIERTGRVKNFLKHQLAPLR